MKTLLTLLSLLIFCSCGEGPETKNQTYTPWSGGEVLYSFLGDISEKDRSLIESVFDEIETRTKCVYFIETETGNPVHIYYGENKKACSATVGSTNSNNYLQLSEDLTARDIYHEVFHILGLFHEHQRPDRDEHIVVEYNNVYKGAEYLFDVVEPLYDTNALEYESGSIMQYNSFAFSKNGGPTLYFLPGSDYEYSPTPTELDYQKLMSIYTEE